MRLPSLTPKEHLLAQLRREGIADERVIDALRRIPREVFIPPAFQGRAYENTALPIASRQTISQPYVVARMAEALRLTGTEHVLEVGTGSGYGAAVLAELALTVVTIEILDDLAEAAASRLANLGYTNVSVVVGDGSLGWPAAAPYHAISVTASSPQVPIALVKQLSPRGGRLVAPIGSLHQQELILIERFDQRVQRHSLGQVRFVPLLGAAGFQALDPARKN